MCLTLMKMLKCKWKNWLSKIQFFFFFFWFSGWAEHFLTVFWISRANFISRSVLVNHAVQKPLTPWSFESCDLLRVPLLLSWYGEHYWCKYSVIISRRFFRTPCWSNHLRWKCSAWKHQVFGWLKTAVHSDGLTPSLWDFDQSLRWALDFLQCGL